MNSMRACVDVLRAGGSPAQWCRGFEHATAQLAAIGASVQAMSAAAGAAPSLVDHPLFGVTLAELTDCPPAAEGEDLHWADQPGRQDHAASRSTTGSMPPSMPAVRPQPSGHDGVRRVATGCRSPDPALSRMSAGQQRASRVSTDRPRNLAGELPPAIGIRQSFPELIKPEPSPRARTRGNPGARMVRHPGPETLSPDWPGGEQFLRAVAAAVWRRVGGSPSPPPDQMLMQVTRPGPTATAELLRRIGSGDRDRPASAGRRPSTPSHEEARLIARRGDAEQPRPKKRQGAVAQRPTAGDSVIKADDVGEYAARTVSRFAEQSTMPPQDRAGLPVRGTWPGPMTPQTAQMTSSPASAVPADDLERLMERVLRDAARRHGIEV